jgi:hypothetical protein
VRRCDLCALVRICDARGCLCACSAAVLCDAWKRNINKGRHSQRDSKPSAYFVVPECLSIIRYHDQSPIAGVMFMAGKFILLNDNNRLRRRWVDIIKIDLDEIECGGVLWIDLT